MKYLAPTALVLFLADALFACSFCGDGFARRQTLRERFAESNVVVAGKLKNAVANADGTGTTDFEIESTLKGTIGKRRLLVIPRYLPVIGDTSPQYLFFCTEVDGKLEPVHGVPGGKALVEYLKSVSETNGIPKRLAIAFAHLDSSDPTVSSEAFLEFARASDAELAWAKQSLDRKKLRAWIADAKTPMERLGVYGLLLGFCGDRSDAEFLLGLLKSAPLPERVGGNLGGLLCGAILLEPEAGWKFASALLAEPNRNFSDKLGTISTVRFFQATRPKESRDRIIASLAVVITIGDLADLAIDDLRRWQWWDLTDTILDQYPKPTHSAPAVRRGIVRYALQCPDATAKAFIASVRGKDPALVKKVEDNLKLFEKK